MAKREAKSRVRGRGAVEHGTVCGCRMPANAGPDTSAVSSFVGPGGSARGVDATLRDANLRHLRRIEGQVRGVAAMVEGGRYCADIITQIAAIRESLHAVSRNLMRNHLNHCAAAAMQGDAASRERVVDELMQLVGRVAQ